MVLFTNCYVFLLYPTFVKLSKAFVVIMHVAITILPCH